MLLASCSLEDALRYKNKLILVSEDEGKKKPEDVLLNIVINSNHELGEVLMKGLGVAKCVTTSTSPEVNNLDDKFKGKIFRIYRYKSDYGTLIGDSDDFSLILEEVDGVVPLVVFPKDFSDMRFVYDLAKKYPSARFTGGNLLGIPGINIGRFDDGKEKMSAVFNGVYDVFKEVNLADIEVREVMSKIRSSGTKKATKDNTSITKKSSSTPKKPSAMAKKSEAFSKMFGGGTNSF